MGNLQEYKIFLQDNLVQLLHQHKPHHVQKVRVIDSFDAINGRFAMWKFSDTIQIIWINKSKSNVFKKFANKLPSIGFIMFNPYIILWISNFHFLTWLLVKTNEPNYFLQSKKFFIDATSTKLFEMNVFARSIK